MILAVATTAAGFTRCSLCAYKGVCYAREDFSEEDTEIRVLAPTDRYREAWQRSRPFSDTIISPTAWANAVDAISLCADCAENEDALAAGVLTTAGEAAVEEGLSAWMVTQQIARQQQAARRRGVVFPPLIRRIPGLWDSDGLE
jgi:hypothetical protein